ncbi:magnesium transporter [Sphingomonas sp. XMGL2]|uniref:Magnesium transporter n=2 Tax=Sphingomonas quercus TaxID=2842451 RepID=A0ABS6BLL3_9SPHN|nr:magnesium transporter [Sphingomonas quercus]
MIGVAGVAAVANAVAAVAAPDAAPIPTRLGVQIAQSAADHDQVMASQRRALDLREQATRAAEQRLKAELAARQAPAPQAGGARGGGANGGQSGTPDAVDQPYDDLARIYQTMKPARAAPVFERLDLDVQMQVAKRMRERNTAMILSSMSPQAAVRLSMALAGKPIGPAPEAAPQPVAAPAPAPAPVAQPERAQPRGKTAAARPPLTRAAAPKQAGAGAPKEEITPPPPKA